jgi:hypothetical protein
MTDEMTIEEFEALVSLYGPQATRWPDAKKAKASVVAATDAGAAVLSAEAALDNLLSGATELAIDATSQQASCNDRFLTRLADIPASYQQADPVVQDKRDSWWRSLLDGTFDFLSPAALASQAAAFVVVMATGIAFGLNSQSLADDAGYTDYDISEAWLFDDAELDINDMQGGA